MSRMSQKKNFSANERDSLINHEMTDPQSAPPFAVRKLRVGPGAWLLSSTPLFKRNPLKSMQCLAFLLTFLAYTCYHMTRKAFSAVKSNLQGNNGTNTSCNITSDNMTIDPGWYPFNTQNGEDNLGLIDISWLFAYALAMFASGIIAERVDLRSFLTIGMIGNGVCVGLLGVAYFAHLHSLVYFVVFQLLAGMLSATGWPAVVAVMGNWFGKRGRALFMGVWNAHTSFGNILGVLIPGIWIGTGQPWGWSFIAPALIMIGMGITIFLFLVVDPKDVGLPPPLHHEGTNPFSFRKKTVSRTAPSINIVPNTVSSNHNPSISEVSKSKKEELEEEQKMLISEEDSKIIEHESCSHLSDHRRIPSSRSITPESFHSHATSPPPLLHQKSTAIGFFSALKIPGVIEYSLALFFNKLVAYTFLFWLPVYITDTCIDGHPLGPRESDWFSSLFDVGGLIGSILIGLFSDLLNMRAVLCIAMLYLSIPMLAMYFYLGHLHLAATLILLTVSGLLVNGPYAIITTAVSTDLSTHKSLKDSKRAKATVSAIIDGTGSIGAGVGPLLTTILYQRYSDRGWQYVFFLLMGSEFVSALFLTRLVVTELKRVWKQSSCRQQHNVLV